MCQRVHNNIHYFTQWKNKSTKQTNIYNTNCQHRLPAIRISNLVPTHHATKSFITFPCNWFILTLLQMHGPWPSDQRERTREKLVRQKNYMARSPHYNPFVPAVIKNHTQRHSEQQWERRGKRESSVVENDTYQIYYISPPSHTHTHVRARTHTHIHIPQNALITEPLHDLVAHKHVPPQPP